MSSPEDIASLSREDLLALVAELQHQVTVPQKQVAELAGRNESLVAENEHLKRSAKRQATPLSYLISPHRGRGCCPRAGGLHFMP
jgi:predicted Zn-ribbon and HTH transcriptional regulator